MKKRVSIKDIAALIGVSTAAVSYVLNGGGKEGKISAEVAKKIKATAARLNYQPNLSARSLQSGKTKTIGLVMEDISNPFFSQLASIIEKDAQDLGYTIIIGCHYENRKKSATLLNTLVQRQVDGIIISPVDGSVKQIRQLQKTGIPVVLVDRYFSDIKSNTVTINNFDISYQAVRHLIQQGYKKIGMIAFQSTFEHLDDRIQGYKTALSDAGLRFSDNHMIRVSFTDMQRGNDVAIQQMLEQKNRPDALFLANNIIGARVLNYIRHLGIEVPTELGIVCFDQRDIFDYFPAPVSYIQQDLVSIGQQSLQLLMKKMNTKRIENENHIIHATLIIRESSLRKSRRNVS